MGLASAAFLLLGPPAGAEQLELTFPVAKDSSLFAVQKTLVEAWTIISETFVDPTYSSLDWERELSQGLNTVAAAADPRAASAQIASMVGKLGDPYTRWVPPQ